MFVLMKVQEISKPQMGSSKKHWQVKTVITVDFKYLRVSLVLTENTQIGFHLLEMLIFSRDKYKFYWNWSMIYFEMITAEQRVNILTFSYQQFTPWVRHLLPHKYQGKKKPVWTEMICIAPFPIDITNAILCLLQSNHIILLSFCILITDWMFPSYSWVSRDLRTSWF